MFIILSVLIALKDERTRQNIASFINWEKIELELIASTGNGVTAQSLTKSLKPDIVITQLDIKGIYMLLSNYPIYHTAIFGEGEKDRERAFGK